MSHRFPVLTAEEAADMIDHEMTVGFSGFTPAGAAKAVPTALAAKARRLHARDQAFRLRILNGIGGSGDFVRNAYLSVMVCPSVAKRGAISTIVPMVTHVDHNEHSLQILVTEQGLADLRGKGPAERARVITEEYAHPQYREYLRRYVAEAPVGHIRHDLDRAFELHRNLRDHGAMLPDIHPQNGS